MSRLTRDGTAEPVSRDQILRRERRLGNIHFSCSADHEQDWQPYEVDPYSCYMMYDHTYKILFKFKSELRHLNLFSIHPVEGKVSITFRWEHTCA